MKWYFFISEYLHVILHPKVLVCTINTSHVMKREFCFYWH